MQFRVPLSLDRTPSNLGALNEPGARPLCSATVTTACVKSYVINGKTVWGSYQLPALTSTIRRLQEDLVKLDRQVSPSGLVDATTVLALTNIVKLTATKRLDYGTTSAGQTLADLSYLIAIKAADGDQGFTAKKIAQNAEAIGGYVSAMAYTTWSTKWFAQPTPKPPAPVEPKPQPKPSGNTPVPSGNTPVPTDAVAVHDDASGREPKLPWLKKHPKAPYYIGGGVVAAGLLAATLFVWFAPASPGGIRNHDD
jgi:hypothetical protein